MRGFLLCAPLRSAVCSTKVCKKCVRILGVLSKTVKWGCGRAGGAGRFQDATSVDKVTKCDYLTRYESGRKMWVLGRHVR